MGFLKKIIGGALGALGSSGGPLSSIGPMIGKIAGIPMPGDPRTGADLGKDARAYFDEAFPGTNPWERLGSSYGGGAVEVAKQQTKSQEQLQARELRTREKIAKIQARAQTTSAAVAHGPEAVTALDSFSRTGRVGNFNTPTTIAWKKLQPELDNIAADTRLKQTGAYKNMQEAMLTGAKGAIEKAKVPFAKQLAELYVNEQMSKRELTFLLNALDQAGVKFGDPSQWGQALGEKTRKQFSSWWDMFIGRMTHERNRTPYPAPIPHEKSIPAKPSTR